MGIMTKLKKKESVQAEETAEPIALENAAFENTLRAHLEEIRNYDGVVGYILRNTTSASIDLKDPAKLIDYALLSSTVSDAADELSRLFNLDGVKEIIVDGKKLRMLSLTIEKNGISIFLENGSDLEKVLKRIRLI
jgi:predicted regulator of Ras-like GTPase activity (Roadblock/LC7/MglB family)